MAIFNVGNRIIEPGTWPWGYPVREKISEHYLSFDGVNDYAKVTNTVLPAGSGVTVEAWVFVKGKGGDSWNRFIDLQEGDGSGSRYALFWDEDDYMYGFATGGGNVTVNSPPPLNSWIHLAGVSDPKSGRVILYQDGVEITSGNITTTHNDLFLCVGKRYDAEDWSNINVKELRIWDHPRTQAQIASQMNFALSFPSPGLVAYYRMNKDTDTVFVDVANGKNGTIYGAIWA
jgi:hypothetical protein